MDIPSVETGQQIYIRYNLNWTLANFIFVWTALVSSVSWSVPRSLCLVLTSYYYRMNLNERGGGHTYFFVFF